MIRRTI